MVLVRVGLKSHIRHVHTGKTAWWRVFSI